MCRQHVDTRSRPLLETQNLFSAPHDLRRSCASACIIVSVQYMLLTEVVSILIPVRTIGCACADRRPSMVRLTSCVYLRHRVILIYECLSGSRCAVEVRVLNYDGKSQRNNIK